MRIPLNVLGLRPPVSVSSVSTERHGSFLRPAIPGKEERRLLARRANNYTTTTSLGDIIYLTEIFIYYNHIITLYVINFPYPVNNSALHVSAVV